MKEIPLVRQAEDRDVFACRVDFESLIHSVK